jgi:DNA-binding LacI/PurR family transcriptional regulator
MRPERPTITDVARLSGLSTGAVSYALNGRPGVSEATRARVRGVADEIGFRPHRAARALKGAPALAVGMGLSRPARVLGLEPFFMELISGIEAELASQSYALLLQVVPDHPAEVETYQRWWGERRVDGVIVVDLTEDDIRVGALDRDEVPTVLIGGPEGTGGLAHVWSDDEHAVEQIVGYLCSLGHRRVARVSGPAALMHTRRRDAAFRTTGARAGFTQRQPVRTDYTAEQSARATRRLLRQVSAPTAIVYDNDVMALAGLATAHEMGLRVPDDVSLVAWDDSPLTRLVHPAFTAISRDITAYGRLAASALLRVLAGEEVGGAWGGPCALTVRGTTGPAPRR